ncbi:hypothetical protein T08_14905, partial [Trichinella sp. T8]
MEVSSVIKRYSYHMISKESIHYCSDKADRNKQAVLEISFTFTGEAEQRFQFQRNCFAMGEEWQIIKKCIHYSSIKVFCRFYFQMIRNSLGLNLKVVWITLLCFRSSIDFQ